MRRPDGVATLPLTIVNENPTVKNTDIFLTYFGELPGTNTFVHVVQSSTGLEIVKNKPGKLHDVSFAVTPGKPIDLPLLKGWRLYVSLNKGMDCVVAADGNIDAGGTAGFTGNPNFNTIYDFFEGDYSPGFVNGPLLTIDLSNVQSANIPMSYSLAGIEPSSKEPVSYLYGWKPGGWTAFLAGLNALETDAANADFAKLILPTTGRVLEPGEAIGADTPNVFKNTYYDAYIDDIWTYFTTNELQVGGPDLKGTWVGKVTAGNLVFTPPSSLAGGEPIAFAKPTAKQIFLCSVGATKANGGPCVVGCDQTIPVGLISYVLQAAFNRSVSAETLGLGLNTSPVSPNCAKSAKFYENAITNYYSKYIHENSYEGKAYAFPSDDTCAEDNLAKVVDPKPLTITLVKP